MKETKAILKDKSLYVKKMVNIHIDIHKDIREEKTFNQQQKIKGKKLQNYFHNPVTNYNIIFS